MYAIIHFCNTFFEADKQTNMCRYICYYLLLQDLFWNKQTSMCRYICSKLCLEGLHTCITTKEVEDFNPFNFLDYFVPCTSFHFCSSRYSVEYTIFFCNIFWFKKYGNYFIGHNPLKRKKNDYSNRKLNFKNFLGSIRSNVTNTT